MTQQKTFVYMLVLNAFHHFQDKCFSNSEIFSKLDSHSKQLALSNAHFCIWSRKQWAHRSISKARLPLKQRRSKSWRNLTSRAFHTHDTGFYWSSSNYLLERLQLGSSVAQRLSRNPSSSPLKCYKQLAFLIWLQLKGVLHLLPKN